MALILAIRLFIIIVILERKNGKKKEMVKAT